MHKHAAGVYGSKPLEGEFKDHDIRDQKDCLAGTKPVEIKDQVTGIGIIETYTIIYAMDQNPSYAVLYGKTPDNFRFIARTQNHPDIFNHLTKKNRVGQKVTVKFDPSRNMNIADLI